MAIHISLRLAWHNDGWNGHICKDPKCNIYCIGQHSYPGTSILENRDIDLELQSAGKHCSKCKFIPPCSFSINAFGDKPVMAAATPPAWFNDDTQVKNWEMSPATASVWDYEDMYGDDVLNKGDSSQTYNYDKRLEKAKEYYSSLKLNETLIFYYSNYSNPFSEDENKNYIIVGVSRLKTVGEIMYYEGTSQKNRDKYAGGFVWQMPITSHYPDEGFKIPYHLYMENPEILKGMITIPENSRNFKYATRAISDDDALILIEQLLATVNYLININDKSENWVIRKIWLESLLGELWKNRGVYPGFPSVLQTINFTQAIPHFKKETLQGQEITSFNHIIDFLENDNIKCEFCSITEKESINIKRQWKLKSKEQRQLLRDIIPLFDISREQIEKILADDREKNGIIFSLNEIINNPYILSEQYIGDGPDDFISFNKIDNGLLPSPELGVTLKTDKDSPERFRALVVNKLKQENKHSFLGADKILSDINFKMDMLPEWKTHHFSIQYFEVDEKILSESLVIRTKMRENIFI